MERGNLLQAPECHKETSQEERFVNGLEGASNGLLRDLGTDDIIVTTTMCLTTKTLHINKRIAQ